MIYLTLDSNIFVYSIEDAWKIDNQLDYLEAWLESGEVKLLIPEVIQTEWQRIQAPQVKLRREMLKNFFNMAEEILPSAFFADYKKPAVQEQIIADHFERINQILSNAETIQLCPEIERKVVSMGIAKRAPQHKKNSVADAVIVYSLIKYVENNPGSHFFFASNNTADFFDPNKIDIHEDLKPDFDRLNIGVFKDLNTLNNHLKMLGLSSFDLAQRRRERFNRKIKEKVYNPEYEKITADRESSFISNINMLEFILNESKPTKEQVIFVLALIDSDSNYERVFFDKVTGVHWFKILESKGIFNPENNPRPTQNHVPYWEMLSYLEKISLLIKSGQQAELIDRVLTIIKKTSQKHNDNYRTWYKFIQILGNLPNDTIPQEILHLIPLWLKSSLDTRPQSSAICEILLPKFLNEKPTQDDILKAEIIFSHLFQIDQNEIVSSNDTHSNNIYSRVHLWSLSSTLIDKKLINRAALFCSDDVFLTLGSTLKKMLIDYQDGIPAIIREGKNIYDFRLIIQKDNLLFTMKGEGEEAFREIVSLINFEDLTEEELKYQLEEILKYQNIQYSSNGRYPDFFDSIIFALHNDLVSSFGIDTIKDLVKKSRYQAKESEIFAIIFIEYLNQKVKFSPKEGLVLLQKIVSERPFRIPFFKRVALYVIAENWKETKSLFWELVSTNDPLFLFSKYKYSKDLYNLLNKVQSSLVKKEKEILETIISSGPQTEREDEGYDDYWRLSWYSALNGVEPFKGKYEILSNSQNLTKEHFEDSGKIRFSSDSIPPITVEELLSKSNQDIVAYITAFKPDNWHGPTISGLSDILKTAVINDPVKFLNELDLYESIPYIYAYHIIGGLQEVWKRKSCISFDWAPVLKFCLSTILNSKFYSEELYLDEDSWKATSEWVVGAIANLLTEGLQNDGNSLSNDNLPKVKEVLQVLVRNLKKDEKDLSSSKDYYTYIFNSTAGKVLRALLDYSLFRAHSLPSKKKSVIKWESEIKVLFEMSLKRDIIDAYIIEGVYFQHFYFLDKKWACKQIEQNVNLDDIKWQAFWAGFGISNPPPNIKVYNLFYPHYLRAINAKADLFSHRSTPGFISHLVAFYFWGFESLNSGGLVKTFLEKSKSQLVLKFVNYVGQQQTYFNTLEQEEADRFDASIIELWKYLALKYEKKADEQELEILGSLVNFIVLINALNQENTDLIVMSLGLEKKYYFHERLIRTLVEFQRKGDSFETAQFLSQIILKIRIESYFLDKESETGIKTIIQFLFENGQAQAASTVCNETSRQGNMFLRELYEKYN